MKKMKKAKRMINLKGVICTALLLALMSITAFAGAEPGSQEDRVDVISVNELIVENNAKNMLVSGTVTNIEAGKEFTTISVDNDNLGMVFHVSKTVFVIDKKTNAYLTIADIKKGMTVTAVLDKMSPMTMSIPPQTSGAIGFIINSDQGFIDVSTYNDELVNFENTLQLNIDSKTKIVDVKGTKRAYRVEDLKKSECLVLYNASTRSIPAQTTPEFVMILNTAEELVATPDENPIIPEQGKYVPLRTMAEAKGYLVKWEAATKSVVLTKDDIRVEIAVGSVDFVFTHQTKDLKPLDKMDRLDLKVKLENGKTMVSDTFMNAL